MAKHDVEKRGTKTSSPALKDDRVLEGKGQTTFTMIKLLYYVSSVPVVQFLHGLEHGIENLRQKELKQSSRILSLLAFNDPEVNVKKNSRSFDEALISYNMV